MMRLRVAYRKTYFIKFIFFFFVFVLLITGLSASLLLSKSKSIMIDEISKDSQYRLANIRDYLENVMLPKYEAPFLGKVLSTINPQSEEDIAFFLNNKAAGNGTRITKLNRDLDTVRYANHGISNITLYYQSSAMVIGADYYYEDPNNSRDTAFIASLSTNAVQPHRWFYRELDNKPLFTYVYTLPYLSEGAAVKAYMYIDLDVVYLSGFLERMLSTSSESLHVYDRNNRLLLSTANSEFIDRQVFDKLQARTTGFETIRTHGETTVAAFSSFDSSVNDWSFVVTRPLDSFLLSSGSMQQQIVFVCALVLLVGLIVSFLLSRFFYKPWKKLIFNIRHVYKFPWSSSNQENEYKVIDQLLYNLDKQMEMFHDKLRDSRLFHVIRGSLHEADEFPVPLDAYYAAAYIRSKEPLSKELMQRYREVGHSLSYETVCMSNEEWVILFTFEERSEDYALAIRSELDKFALVTGRYFISGIGSLVSTVEEISVSFQQAVHASKYIFLMGDEKTFCYEKISGRNQVLMDLQLEQFKNAMHAADISGVKQYLDDFQTKLKDGHVTIEVTELAFMHLVMSLFQVMLEHRLQDIKKTVNDLYAACKKETLESSLQMVYSHCNELVGFIKSSLNHSHAETVHLIQTYINDHLNEDISLDVLSGITSYSPSYISTLFKEVMHKSFMEYLNQTRLDKAAGLLLEQRLSVSDVAEEVGFKNAQYFATKFKNKFGVTPSQYRNSANRKSTLNPEHIS